MSHQREYRVKNGTFNILTHTTNRRMFFHKYKMLKTIVVMPVVKSRIRGVTQQTIQFDGNRVTFLCAVSCK